MDSYLHYISLASNAKWAKKERSTRDYMKKDLHKLTWWLSGSKCNPQVVNWSVNVNRQQTPCNGQ